MGPTRNKACDPQPHAERHKFASQMKIVGTLNGIEKYHEYKSPIRYQGLGVKFYLTTLFTKPSGNKRGSEKWNSTTDIEIRVAIHINQLTRNGE